MRNIFFITLAGLLVFLLILSGCNSTPTATTPAKPTATAIATTPAANTPSAQPPVSSTAPGNPVTSNTPASTSTTTASANYPIPLNPNAQTGGTLIFNHNASMSFISAPADGPQLTMRVGREVFEPLLICDSNENILPWLATSFSTSADGKAITLKLRQGIKFSDGTDFNAESVKFNLDLDMKNNVIGSAGLKKITSYDIPDPYTITINLSAPDATFLLNLAQGIVGMMASPTAQQKPTTPENITQIHMVGTGPFLYDSWQRDNFVQFKANPNYWQKGKPYLAGMRWNFIADQTSSLLAFRSGQANIVLTIDPVDAVSLKKDGYSVGSPPMKLIHYLCPDGANPDSPFAKTEVRQALEYALNKDELVSVGSGYFDVATQFAKPTDAYFDSTITPRKYDVAKAKQLLASAGYPNGVPVVMITNQSIRVDTENLILSQLKAAGFNVNKVDTQTAAAYQTTMQKGWRSDTRGVGSILMPGFPNGDNLTSLISRFNTTLYPDQYQPAGWIDSWNSLQATADTAQRNAKLKALTRQMFDTALVIPYQFDSSRYVTDNKIQGFSDYWQSNNFADFLQPAELWLKTK